MTFSEIVDLFERLPEGGIWTDENRFDPRFVETAVNRSRALSIFNFWSKTKRINPVWTQQYIPTFSQELQDDPNKVIFQCPPAISLSEQMDGFLYIGTVDGNCSFRKVVSRAELANSNVHRNMRTLTDHVKVIYSDGFLECYGNTDLKSIRIDAIFADPTQVPSFNADKDEYPASLDIIESMKIIAFNTEQKIITSRPAELKPDKAEEQNTK